MLEQKQTYKIAENLLGFQMAEECRFECRDGETRLGVFIPYEENNVYKTEKHAWVTITALPMAEERRKTPWNRNNTHDLIPYWTWEQKKKYAEAGVYQDSIKYGFMGIQGFYDRDMRERNRIAREEAKASGKPVETKKRKKRTTTTRRKKA